ncbi:MAG: precorrin-6A reductase, partial [Pseudomonadota bacterium]
MSADADAALPLYLIGGTSEANRAALRLAAEGFRVTVSVATAEGGAAAARAGLESDGPDRLDADGMARRAAGLGAAAIVDCSHPFAVAASESALAAAGIAGLPYLRFCREPYAAEGEGVFVASGWEEAVHMLQGRRDRALLTVGTRHLEIFSAAGIDFTARVLPVAESLAECARLGIGPERIIAAHPPFDVDFNRACIRKAGAGVLVTKESGREGGLPGKLEAARAEGILALVVSRPPERTAIHD